MPYTMITRSFFGCPVYLEKPLERNDLPSNTVAEVYTQVIRDLTDAINSGYLTKGRLEIY